jgi:hypothetical protein
VTWLTCWIKKRNSGHHIGGERVAAASVQQNRDTNTPAHGECGQKAFVRDHHTSATSSAPPSSSRNSNTDTYRILVEITSLH